MGYCTEAEVLSMLKSEMLTVILADTDMEDEAAREELTNKLLEQTITDAEAEINGYIAARYTVPFVNPPAIINKIAKDIAAYNMVSRVGIDEQDRDKTYLTRYNAAIKYLEAVATGKIELGTSSTAQMAKKNFQMQSSKRVFSRDKMRGW